MEERIKELEKRIDLLEKIIGDIQLRLGFAGEPHKDQTYGPLSVTDMIRKKGK